jgi:hypothetical protein
LLGAQRFYPLIFLLSAPTILRIRGAKFDPSRIAAATARRIRDGRIHEWTGGNAKSYAVCEDGRADRPAPALRRTSRNRDKFDRSAMPGFK